jgi:predicted RNA-binding protein YlqC (UPF0109 family)
MLRSSGDQNEKNMMTTSQQRVDKALELIKAVLLGLCKYPETLQFEPEERSGSMQIRITCHPTDSRRIVGKHGTHLRAIDSLARLLFWKTHLLVTILPITSTDEPETPWEKFEPREDWPEQAMKGLLHDLAVNVFHRCEVFVGSDAAGRDAHRLTVYLTPFPASEPHVVKRFASAVSILLIPIGTQCGRKLYADVATK